MTPSGKPTSEILDRVPPSDPQAETWVLGSAMLAPSCLDEIGQLLRPEDFHVEANGLFWRHLLAMHDQRKAVSAELVLRRLRDAGDLELIGGAARLAEVMEAVPHAQHAAHYAAIVASKAKYRRVIHACLGAITAAYAAVEPIDEVLNRVEKSLAEIGISDREHSPEPIVEPLLRLTARIDEQRRRQQAAGLMTGIVKLDNRNGGIFPGELAILAARPGIGKTAFACQVADYVASTGKLCYMATLEMGNEEIAQRFVCSRAGVSSQKVRTGDIHETDYAAIAEASNSLAEARLIVHDQPGATVYDIRRAARRYVRQGLALVVVDYLQIITPDDRRVPRVEQIGRMTRGLKMLARELKVPVLCLCQLNRAAMSEKKGIPRLEHLRESGDIEQDADLVMFLHREYEPTSEVEKLETLLVIAKNRNATTGVIRLTWHPSTTRFVCEGVGEAWDPDRPF